MVSATLTRRAMKDITLSDGTRIPEGTLLQAATYPQHHDDAYFEDANTFDPFRFARKRGAAGEGVKHQASTTAPEYLPFGHGKVAWCVSLTFSLVAHPARVRPFPEAHSHLC